MNVDRAGAILCFGEVLLRLSAPVGVRIRCASSFEAHVGGAEANVAALLAQLGNGVEMVTVLPRSSLGDLCESELRRVGVGTAHVVRADGRLGLYFVGRGLGSAGQVTYDRKNSVFSTDAEQFDWAALASGARWFHLSGINLALGGEAARAAAAAVNAMKNAGVAVSFDVNHRASLWKDRPLEDFGQVRQIAAQADVLFASPRDIALILERECGKSRDAAEAAFGAFSDLQLIACTRRQFDDEAQLLSARIDDRERGYEAPPVPLRSVIDRIGSGDAFAGALIDGILRRAPLEEGLERALAAAVSKHHIAGDRWIGGREELDAYEPSRAQDVQR